MENDVSFLGKVIRVDSNEVEVEISGDIPSSSPIVNGKVYKIGQIGTFVKIVAGNVVIFGLVDAVNNAPSKELDSNREVNTGSRFLRVSLVGEKIGNRKFERGIGLYPTINDEVHLVTEEDLRDIYGGQNREHGLLAIGKHASSETLDVYIVVRIHLLDF